MSKSKMYTILSDPVFAAPITQWPGKGEPQNAQKATLKSLERDSTGDPNATFK